MPEKRRGVIDARALKCLWTAALCLCLAVPAAQALTGSGDSPVFPYNAYECMVKPGTDSEDSPEFSYNAYECQKKPKSAMAESLEFFGSYIPVGNDCVVNVLDLIRVRNDLGKTGCDKLSTDVNGDCKVNILDLIAVRNLIGRRCSE